MGPRCGPPWDVQSFRRYFTFYKFKNFQTGKEWAQYKKAGPVELVRAGIHLLTEIQEIMCDKGKHCYWMLREGIERRRAVWKGKGILYIFLYSLSWAWSLGEGSLCVYVYVYRFVSMYMCLCLCVCMCLCVSVHLPSPLLLFLFAPLTPGGSKWAATLFL